MQGFKKYLAEKLLSEEFGYEFSLDESVTEVMQLQEKGPAPSVAPQKENKSDSDAKGKLMELLVGAHANGGVKNGQVVKHAEDTRSKGKKAKDIHDALVTSMFGKEGTNHPRYKKFMKAAHDLHKEWERKNLKPGEKVVASHWSSQPGDMEAITGKKDPNSKADVIHVIKDAKGNVRYAPVSLKVGAGDPNLANNGSKTLAHHSGAEEKDLTDHWKAHTERMGKIYGEESTAAQRQAMGKMDEKMGKEGIEGIRKYHKELTSKKNPDATEKARIEAAATILNAHDKAKTPKAKQQVIQDSLDRHEHASQSSIQARTAIAAHIAKSFNAGKPEDADTRIRQGLLNMASPRTVHKQSIGIAHEHADGSVTPHVFDSEDLVRNHIDQYHGLHAEASGISVNYYGINKKTGKREKIVTHGMKQGNGPHAGWNSTMTMPGIIKKTLEREDSENASNATDKAITKAKTTSVTAKPVAKPTVKPVAKPVAKPTVKPVAKPTVKPVAKPTVKPVAKPTVKPVAKTKVVTNILNKRKAAAPSAYDYENARGQDLGRKAKSGDETAQKEIERRKAGK